MSEQNDEKFTGTLFTKHDELNFFNAETFANKEGNICISFDGQSYCVLTPLMAKRLNFMLGEAIRTSIGMIMSQKLDLDE